MQKLVTPYMGTYDKTTLESLVLKAEMKATSLGVQLYCGEFGCYKKTPAADRMEWIRDVVSILKDGIRKHWIQILPDLNLRS